MSRDEEIKEFSLRIAKHSAHKDKCGEWWGDDTNVGHLPERIEAELSVFEESVRLSTLEEIEKRLETMKCFADGILSFTSWKYTKAKTKEEFQEAGMKVFFEGKELLKLIEELKQRGTKT